MEHNIIKSVAVLAIGTMLLMGCVKDNDGPYGNGGPELHGDYTYHSTYTFAGDTGHFYGGGDDSYNNAAIRLVNTDSIEIETTYGWKGFSRNK